MRKKKTGINITIEYKNLLITRWTEKFLWSNLQQPSQVNVTPAESGIVWPQLKIICTRSESSKTDSYN